MAEALGSIVDLITKVAPMITGTKQTSTESTSLDPSSQAAIQQLIAQITGQGKVGAGGENDAIIAAITDKVKQAILPVVGQQQQAGLYNSTALTDFAARLGGEGVKQSAETLLKSRDAGTQSLAYLLANTGKAGARTTRTVATPGNPLLQALSVGTAGYGAAQKTGIIGALAKKKAAKDAADILTQGIDAGTLDEAGNLIGSPLANSIDLGATDASLGAAGAEAAGVGAAGVGAEALFGASEALAAGDFLTGGVAAESIGAGAAAGIGAEAAIGAGAAEAAGGFALEELLALFLL